MVVLSSSLPDEEEEEFVSFPGAEVVFVSLSDEFDATTKSEDEEY